MHSIDDRMLAFVAWHGEIPADAVRIEDFVARQHAATWIRRFIDGRSVSYVIGFTLGSRWWTLFFDRVDELFAPQDADVWEIEAYGSDGKGWSERYFYWPEHNRWRHVFHASAGEDYGRAPAPRGERALPRAGIHPESGPLEAEVSVDPVLRLEKAG